MPARAIPARGLPEAVQGLLVEKTPRRRLGDLVLSDEVLRDVQEFLAEQAEVALLRANSLEPRHAVLLAGPPGNGKTSLAEAMASELGLPFLTVRYDGIVDSFLGETAARIRRVVEYASAVPCLLFFDEFDAIGKDRGDRHETGEIKRVVNSLLMQLDALPSHCVVACATNHPELLDRAVWRRFELRIELGAPGPAETARMHERFAKLVGDGALDLCGYSSALRGRSLAEMEQFNLDVRRGVVLSRGALAPRDAAASVVARWARRYSPPSETNATDGFEADRKDPSPARRRKPKEGKKAPLPEQGTLPGTVG